MGPFRCVGSDNDMLYACDSPGYEHKDNNDGSEEHRGKVHTKNKELFCKTCWKRFSNHNRLLNHTCVPVSGNATCGVLGCSFRASLTALNSHLLSKHDGTISLICKSCMMGFDHVPKFMSHVACKCEGRGNPQTSGGGEKPTSKPLHCSVAECTFVAHNTQQLIAHADSSHPNCKTFVCRSCSKSHGDVRALICHYLGTESCRMGEVSSNGEKAATVMCGAANCREEVPLGKLVSHIVVAHPKVAKFVCKKCNVTFMAVNTFTLHAKACNVRSVKSKPQLGFQPSFRCFYCKALFNDLAEYDFHHGEAHSAKEPMLQLWSVGLNRYTRRQHIDPKTVENEFVCVTCAAQMASEQSLMKHILIIHKQHCCPRCGLLWDTAEELEKHRETTHSKFERKKALEEEQKNREQAQVRRKRGVIAKMMVPRYECYLCSLMFVKKRNLQHHALSRHRVYLCHYCDFVSSGTAAVDKLRQHHMSVHTQAPSLIHPCVKDAVTQTKERGKPSAAEKDHTATATELGSPVTNEGMAPRKQLSNQEPSTPGGTECGICNLKLPSSYAKLQHLYQEHKGYYICGHCSFGCQTLVAMESHNRQMHGDKQCKLHRIDNYVLTSPGKSAEGTPNAAVDASIQSMLEAKRTSAKAGAKRKLNHEPSAVASKAKKTKMNDAPASEQPTATPRISGGPAAISKDAPKKRHACTRCKQGFLERHALHWHMADEHRLRNFCKYCNFGTIQARGLLRHLIVEHPGNEFSYVAFKEGRLIEVLDSPGPLLECERQRRGSVDGDDIEPEATKSDTTEETWSKPSEFSTESEWSSSEEEPCVVFRKTRASTQARITDTTSESEGEMQAREGSSDARNSTAAVVLTEDVEEKPAKMLPQGCREELTSPADVSGEADASPEVVVVAAETRASWKNDTTEIKIECEIRNSMAATSHVPSYTQIISEIGNRNVEVKKEVSEVEVDIEAVIVKQEDEMESDRMSVETQDLDPEEYKSVLVEDKLCVDGKHMTCKKKELLQHCGESSLFTDAQETSPSLKVFGGYRVPKTVGAFQKLLENIGDLYKCCEFKCSFSTMLPKSFLKHLRQHEGTQLFCMYCGVVTSKADDLIPHIDRTHWHSTFQCALCLYRASTKEHIECHFAHAHPNKSARHVTVVTMKDNAAECVVARLDGSQPYCCGFKKCSFQTMKTTNFVEHLRAVHPDEPSYPCPLCEDLKEDVGSLVAHFPEHGINNVQCAYCQHCSVTIGGIMLHLSYCHPDNLANFLFRNSDLEREFMQVVNDNGRVSSHYLIDLVREKSATMCRDLEHILLQQQCPFCTAWCGGFRAFSAHVLEKHRAAVHSHELAEVLFQSYDYKDAVALGRCPFCPFIADSTAELQEHVLDEELVYAPYECHLCMRTYRTEKDLDEHLFDKHVDEQKLVFHNPDTQLLAWVRSNIVIRRDKRSSSSLGETSEAAGCQDDVSYNLPSADSLQVAKPTQNTCPGPSTRCVHSDDGSAPCTEEFVTGQYSCPTCSLKTFSQTFFRRHVETCSDNCTPDVPRPVEGQPAGGSHDGITCGVCAARLSDYQAFVQHSRDAHDLGFTCSICCRAYKKKANLARHTTTIHKEGHSLRRESVDDTKALESGIRGSAAEGRPAGTKELRSHDGTGSAASCHGSARAGEEGSSSCRLDDPPGNTNQLYLRIGQTKVLVDTYLQLVDLEPYVVLRDLVSTLF